MVCGRWLSWGAARLAAVLVGSAAGSDSPAIPAFHFLLFLLFMHIIEKILLITG
jgi:hypothetical protein